METVIHLSRVEVECLIGVHEHERTTPQTVCVDLRVVINGLPAAESDRIADTWDYDHLLQQIEFILQGGQYRLLEAAAHAILRWVLAPPSRDETRAPAQQATVRLSKPSALDGTATPTIEATGQAQKQRYEVELKTWGQVDIISETQDVGLYRLSIDPDEVLPEHYHLKMRECELVLNDGMVGSIEEGPFEPLHTGQRFNWKSKQRHAYRNESLKRASLLCIDSPPFDPEDEILTGAL